MPAFLEPHRRQVTGQHRAIPVLHQIVQRAVPVLPLVLTHEAQQRLAAVLRKAGSKYLKLRFDALVEVASE